MDCLENKKQEKDCTFEDFDLIANQMVANQDSGYYSVLTFDIDNFKAINYIYGFDTGNSILKNIGTILDDFCSFHGGIWCRYYADNFVLLLKNDQLTSVTISSLYYNIKKSILTICHKELHFGRYIVTNKEFTFREMFDRAVIAKDSIKDKKDKYLCNYQNSMFYEFVNTDKVYNSLQDSLKRHEFHIYFQPKFNNQTGKIIGAEALTRWVHKSRVILPPEFIPLLENTGFIYELDQFVWDYVCNFISTYIQRGQEIPPISVCLSKYDVAHMDFFQTLNKIVNRYSFPKNLFTIEIPYEDFTNSNINVQDITDRLTQDEFTVQVDTMYADNLTDDDLVNMRTTSIKLDKQFIDTICYSTKSCQHLKSLIKRANALNIEVIAQGVETGSQNNFLKNVNCTHIQGYFYSKPIEEDDFIRLLSETKINYYKEVAQSNVVLKCSYEGLWRMLKKRRIKKGVFAKEVGITQFVLTKLNHDLPVKMDIIQKICKYLNCNVEDVMQLVKEIR